MSGNLTFEATMSPAEALMWNIEKDPWLNPNGSMVTIFDRPIDFAKMRRRMQKAIVDIPRLRQRVDAPIGRLVPPRWVPVTDFDLDHHLRHTALPADANDQRALLDLACQISQVPFDRTRPLWEMHVIDGLEGGGGALVSKLHHSITDGNGAMRMSLAYMDFRRRVAIDGPTDLDAALREAAEAEPPASPADEAKSMLTGALMSGVGRARSIAAELSTWGADHQRAADSIASITGQIGDARSQVSVGEGRGPGSPLWAERSRKRHLEIISIPLDDTKAAASALGGTVNDLFVAGAVQGAVDHHRRRNVALEFLNVTFVVSTRAKDDSSASNSFTPALVRADASTMSAVERFQNMSSAMAERRKATTGGGIMGNAAALANLLPTSVVTRTARDQASTIDFATSNFRGSPVAAYIAGAKILNAFTLGPVAGTAFNLTTMSFDGSLDMGLHVDPVAVDDSTDLRDSISAAYEELLSHA